MKKIIGIIVIIAIVLVGWYVIKGKKSSSESSTVSDNMSAEVAGDTSMSDNTNTATNNTNTNTNTNMTTKTGAWEGTYVSSDNTIVITKSGSGYVLTYTGPNAFYFKGKKQVSNGTVNSKGEIEARLDTKANGYNGIPSAQAAKNGDLIYTLAQAGDKIEYSYIDSGTAPVVYEKK